MRKPKKLPADVMAAYQWQPPGKTGAIRWGDGPADLVPEGEEARPIDWPRLFGNANPVEIEVGFGKGLFLVTSAVANPSINYFGIEIVRKYQLYATTRIATRQLANAKTCCADAKRVLRDHVTPGSVSALHVYFPDPWWKAKHKKRTLVTPEFAELVARVLTPGGVLHFATDVPEYFEMAQEVWAGVPTFAPLPRPEEAPPEHDMDYLTNFERRFRKQGKPIWRARYARSSGQ